MGSGNKRKIFTHIQASAIAKKDDIKGKHSHISLEYRSHIQAAAMAKKDEIMSRIKGLTSAEEVNRGK